MRKLGRDELMFGTGALTTMVLLVLLDMIAIPWWLNLVLVPPAIWWIVQIIRGWRDELRKHSSEHERLP